MVTIKELKSKCNLFVRETEKAPKIDENQIPKYIKLNPNNDVEIMNCLHSTLYSTVGPSSHRLLTRRLLLISTCTVRVLVQKVLSTFYGKSSKQLSNFLSLATQDLDYAIE